MTGILTNKDLQRGFKAINRQYFGRRLKATVRFKKFSGKDRSSLGYALWELNEIYINQEIRNWWGVVEMTLIHEMAHLALPKTVVHGPKFEKEMLRLAKAGAFKGIW
jgi:predicted metal-dependent hydrolase